jgi:hypothetical protein
LYTHRPDSEVGVFLRLLACAVVLASAREAVATDWNRDGGGNWHDSVNWTAGVPDSPGAVANFLGALTAPNAPANVAVTGNRTVGQIVFDNANTYLLVPGSRGGTLTLDNGGGGDPAVIEARAGAHCISVPLVFNDSLVVDVRVGARMMSCANITVPDARHVTKRGDGSFEARGGLDLSPTTAFRTEQGESQVRYVRGGHVQIAAESRVVVPANGTISGVSKVASLTIDGVRGAWLGRLDLTDNDLIVQADAARREAVLDEVSNQISTARNSPNGQWKGNGVTTTAAEARPLTGLAAVINPGLSEFSGQAVGPDDILVKYTWNGDANVDGRVNADDYFRIDSGFLAQPVGPAYSDGDFNYDGRINADDYFLIDSAFLGQSGSLTGVSVIASTAVPEPTALGVLVVPVLMGTRRRRKR